MFKAEGFQILLFLKQKNALEIWGENQKSQFYSKKKPKQCFSGKNGFLRPVSW